MNQVDLRDLHFNYFKDQKDVTEIIIEKHSAMGATVCIGADIQMDGTAYSSPLWQDDPTGAITAFEGIGKIIDKTAFLAVVSCKTMVNLAKVFEKEQIKMIDGMVKLGARDIKLQVYDDIDIEPEVLLFKSMEIEPESNICLLDRGCKSDFNVKRNKPKWL